MYGTEPVAERAGCKVLLQIAWRTVLVRVVLVGTLALDVMLVVQALGILLRLMLRLLTIKEVLSLRFGQLIDLGAREAGKELLCKLVRDRFACCEVPAHQ